MTKKAGSVLKWTILLSSNAVINTEIEACEIKVETTECAALESFKNSDDYKISPQSCLAAGVTREQAKCLSCDCILIDIPTCLLLESADLHGCSETMASYVANVKQVQHLFAAVNIVILENYEDAFKDSLQRHLTAKNIDVELSNTIDYANNSWVDFAGVVIISNAHLKSNLVCLETNLFPIINIIPVRSNTEAISMTKSLPYKSRLSLWTESANLIFVAWNDLSFGTVSVNSFDSFADGCDLFFNGSTISNRQLNTIAETCGLLTKPAAEVLKSSYTFHLSLKASDNTRSDVCSRLMGPSFALENVLNWCSTTSKFHKVWKTVPMGKLQVGVEVETTRDLQFVVVAMAICGWRSAVVTCPDRPADLQLENVFLQELNVTKECDIFVDCDVVFTPYDAGLKSAKCFGVLKEFDLARYLVYETSTIKHLVLPLSKLSC